MSIKKGLILLSVMLVALAGCDNVWDRITGKLDMDGKILKFRGPGMEWVDIYNALVFRPVKISGKCRNSVKDTNYGFMLTVETNMSGLVIDGLSGSNSRDCFRESSFCEENSGCAGYVSLKSEVKKSGRGNPYFERTFWVDLGKDGSSDGGPSHGEKYDLRLKTIGAKALGTRKMSVYAVKEGPDILEFNANRTTLPRPGGYVRLRAGLRYATGFVLKDSDGNVIREMKKDAWSIKKKEIVLDYFAGKTTRLTLIAGNPAGYREKSISIKVE